MDIKLNKIHVWTNFVSKDLFRIKWLGIRKIRKILFVDINWNSGKIFLSSWFIRIKNMDNKEICIWTQNWTKTGRWTFFLSTWLLVVSPTFLTHYIILYNFISVFVQFCVQWYVSLESSNWILVNQLDKKWTENN